jgi:iron complex transport system substrate-binding protein
MTLSTPVKCAWLLLVLGGVLLTAFMHKDARAGAPPARASHVTPRLTLVDMGGGKQGLVDSGGYAVPLRSYQHIASGTTLADDLLLALAEPERIAALTRFGREHKPDPHRYGQRPSFGGPTDLESLKRQGVDLLILNHLGAPAEIARTREMGIEVFNLGEMRGLVTLLPNIAAVATLLGHPARGERLAEKLVRRMRAVAADIPVQRRKRAVYVSAYGGQLFGGGRRTSYHDVLTSAGLVDAAADKFNDFPHYDPEHLLLMDPDIVVTTPASMALVCRLSGLGNLRACADGGRGVVGLDDALLGDPGLGMLEAAEELRYRAYGPSAP